MPLQLVRFTNKGLYVLAPPSGIYYKTTVINLLDIASGYHQFWQINSFESVIFLVVVLIYLLAGVERLYSYLCSLLVPFSYYWKNVKLSTEETDHSTVFTMPVLWVTVCQGTDQIRSLRSRTQFYRTFHHWYGCAKGACLHHVLGGGRDNLKRHPQVNVCSLISGLHQCWKAG